MPLDTHRAFKRLQEDNVFSPEQAERIAETLADLDVASATQEDLLNLEARLDDRFDRIDERFDRVDERFEQFDERIDNLEKRLTQRNELTEERLNRQLEEAEKRLFRGMIVGLSAVTALLGTLIAVMGYFAGS